MTRFLLAPLMVLALAAPNLTVADTAPLQDTVMSNFTGDVFDSSIIFSCVDSVHHLAALSQSNSCFT